MTINNVQEAADYVNEVIKHLSILAKLSHDAGLNSHAGIWLTIAATFSDSSKEIDIIAKLLETYVRHRIEDIISEGGAKSP